MAFKSKAQVAKIAQLEKEGKVKPGTTKEWAAETPDIGRLPGKVSQTRPKSVNDLRAAYNKKYVKKVK